MKAIEEKKECQRSRKSTKTRRVTQRKPSSGPVCRLCLQEPGDPEKLGEFLQKDDLSVHYFCLILSSKLPQRGQSNQGFHGFLPEDIKKEAARASRKICFVCKKRGAAINCQKDHCVTNFHLPCGQEKGCLSQFFGEYKDAAWELEPGAFSELYQRYQHCDAPICLHEQGRDSFEDEGRWSLILCSTCGSHGTHRDCSFLRSNSKKWECEECTPSAEATGETEGCSGLRTGDGGTCGAWKGGGHATRWGLSGAFSLRRKVAREGLKDLCLRRLSFPLPPFFHHRLHT
ncbi:PHD finger protein 7 [Pteropus alecto]|uniref:PHD finger protein 7 n=1 Tax=Pteropus alecto TaxID=9402 RepID=L5KBF1_PTEAL|nr:PHD finger protein 7 [Pteropus alecto]